MLPLIAALIVSTAVAPIGVVASVAAPNPVPEVILYSFAQTRRIDGAAPLGGVIGDGSGALYGTTVFGGQQGVGTVFTLTPSGSTYRERLLFSFGGLDGAKPWGIVKDARGALYGNTDVGGAHGFGAVFKLTPSMTGYTESVLYSFRGDTDGAQPVGIPVVDETGSLYGVTQFGGVGGGVVFKLTPQGSGYSDGTIHEFAGGADGYLPQAGLTRDKSTGEIFGTTYYGGDTTACAGAGCGEVFAIQRRLGMQSLGIIYRFHGHADGAMPIAPVTVDPRTGVIFGTTQYGGTGCRGLCGTVFALSPSHAGYSESVLYSFTGKTDGFAPINSVLLDANGSIYGMASLGGVGCSGIGCGSVFKMRPVGSRYAFSVLHDFISHADGADPEFSGLIFDRGALIGTTRSGGGPHCSDGGPGGTPGCGVVFKISP